MSMSSAAPRAAVLQSPHPLQHGDSFPAAARGWWEPCIMRIWVRCQAGGHSVHCSQGGVDIYNQQSTLQHAELQTLYLALSHGLWLAFGSRESFGNVSPLNFVMRQTTVGSDSRGRTHLNVNVYPEQLNPCVTIYAHKQRQDNCKVLVCHPPGGWRLVSPNCSTKSKYDLLPSLILFVLAINFLNADM